MTAPSLIETVLRQTSGDVLRSKTDVRSLMAAAVEGKDRVALAGDTDGGFIFPEFHPAFDALFAFAKLLELLAVQETGVAEARAALPQTFMAYEPVPCPWEAKGRIMRVLTEETQDGRTELVDGIKVYKDDGAWGVNSAGCVRTAVQNLRRSPVPRQGE